MMTGKKHSRLVAKNGFTLVEILTAVAIIAILVGILIPALNMVKKLAKDVQQRAQISSIEIGINLYKNEDTFGDYPPSHGTNVGGTGTNYNYCGAQTLTEAMFGQDLLGVDPNTVYEPDQLTGLYADANDRKGPYLDRTHMGVFKAGDVYKSIAPLANEYVICDVYNVVNKRFGNRTYKIGTPVLYFKADTAQTAMNAIYVYNDNKELIDLKTVVGDRDHSLTDTRFYEMITDPMSANRPVRPDSFILISAGADGLYGTTDDICNFEPNIE